MMNRIHQLDYLRGLAAFGIMLYHFLFWSGGDYTSDSIVGRIGVYGVSIFYILSGLTLYHVYINRLQLNKSSLIAFAKKRFFRIFPLLWLATFGTIILLKQSPDWSKLALNLSGLFGVFAWDSYYANGAWSIGNELVFYLFFPLFIWISLRFRWGWLLLVMLFLALYIYFANYVLDAQTALSKQWHNYVNPLNQAFLFVAGFVTGHLLKDKAANNLIALVMLLIGTLVFCYYPVSGDRILLVTGVNRILFTLACLMICIGFFKSNVAMPSLLHRSFSFLGEASYSVYMLHPLVYSVLMIANTRFLHLENGIFLLLTIVATLLVSYGTYQYVEKYFMRIGSRK